MENKIAAIGVLMCVSAYAKKEGLEELDRRVANAATHAFSEIPGASGIDDLLDYIKQESRNLADQTRKKYGDASGRVRQALHRSEEQPTLGTLVNVPHTIEKNVTQSPSSTIQIV